MRCSIYLQFGGSLCSHKPKNEFNKLMGGKLEQ